MVTTKKAVTESSSAVPILIPETGGNGGALALEGAHKLTREQVDLLKRTICRGASDDELALFVQVANRCKLDPFTRQIHAVKRWDSEQRQEVMTVQTGIDGLRVIAERTGAYAGSDEPKFDRETEPHPNRATITVYKMVGGQRVPFTASARWDEYVANKKDGTPNRFWATKPYLMLGKCAESQALRKAFPNDLSGLYADEEMERADTEQEIMTITPARPGDREDQRRLGAEVRAKVEEEFEERQERDGIPGHITPAQRDHLVQLFQHFKVEPANAIMLASEAADREIVKAGDLTPPEYAELIKRLESAKAGKDWSIDDSGRVWTWRNRSGTAEQDEFPF